MFSLKLMNGSINTLNNYSGKSLRCWKLLFKHQDASHRRTSPTASGSRRPRWGCSAGGWWPRTRASYALPPAGWAASGWVRLPLPWPLALPTCRALTGACSTGLWASWFCGEREKMTMVCFIYDWMSLLVIDMRNCKRWLKSVNSFLILYPRRTFQDKNNKQIKR